MGFLKRDKKKKKGTLKIGDIEKGISKELEKFLEQTRKRVDATFLLGISEPKKAWKSMEDAFKLVLKTKTKRNIEVESFVAGCLFSVGRMQYLSLKAKEEKTRKGISVDYLC